MIAIIITIGFVFLAAFFNSVMDATENEPNFNESILKTLNRKFWLKPVSCDYAKKIGGYKFDAWHLSKTGMVFSVAGALIAAIFAGVYLAANPSFLFISASVGAIGATWNGSFKLFYHIIFKVK
jgi:hypothetical protein